jgi:hypothetical protein
MLADTINHIFGIGCTMSADTNNVLGIRGVTPPTQNPNHGEILVCAVRLPKFLTLCAAASLDTASLGASAASLDAASSPPSASTPSVVPPSLSSISSHHPWPSHANPAFGLDATGSAPIIVPDPVVVNDPASLDTAPSTPPPSVPLPPPSMLSTVPPLSSPTLVTVPNPVAPFLTLKVSSLSFFSPHSRWGQAHPSSMCSQ